MPSKLSSTLTVRLGSEPVKHSAPALPERAYWAKLGDTTWHPLAAHLADVGAVTQRLLDGHSVLASRLARALALEGSLLDAVRRTVVYLACLHDIGKVQHGFQRRRHGQHGIPPKMLGHVVPLLRSLKRVPELRAPFGVIARRTSGLDAVCTTICHHGRPYVPDGDGIDPRPFWQPAHTRDPIAQIGRLDELALAWSGLPADAAPDGWRWSPRALHLLAGIVTLADWIGSSERYFEHAPTSDADPIGYWDTACRRADTACAAIGLRPRAISVPMGTAALAHLFPRTFPAHEPTALQRQLVNMPLPAPGTRLVIESDTGSGKTEAALALFARMRAAGMVDGLFFALPTRATASAMHARIRALAERLYADGDPPAIELATGGRQGAGRGDPLSASAAQLPDEPEPAVLERWTSRSTRHAMAAEIVVGTVDQALLAALAARHAHLRLAGIVRLLLVVDEVHAYDRYMTTGLRTLAAMHTATGGIVLFMSATLASETRAQLGGDEIDVPIPTLQDAVARPYPSLSIRGLNDADWEETCLEEARLATSVKRARTVTWSLSSLDDGLRMAISAATAGARVAVLRNTVRAARETLDLLDKLGAQALLWRPHGTQGGTAYHARYTHADRAALDAAILRDFGPGDGTRGTILVTTQVAEQSLDLDFDLLITDLCPIDVLLQRLGRVHRHQRSSRAGYDQPRAIVIEPSAPLVDLVARSKRPFSIWGHGTVYPDFGDLELSRRLIAQRPTVDLPQECRKLVEMVYHPDSRRELESESPKWAAHLQQRDGEDFGAETHAHACVIRFDEPYTASENVRRFSAIAGSDGKVETRVRTRLGDDRVRLELRNAVPNRVSLDGSRDDFVDVDVRVLRRAGIEPASVDQLGIEDWNEDADGIRFTVGRLWLAYDDRGWSWGTRTENAT